MSGQQMSFPCPECGRKFATGQALRSHADALGHSLWECPLCDRDFILQAGLEQHQRALGHYPFNCNRCDLWYDTPSGLETHKHLVHGQKPINYNCNYCQRMFSGVNAFGNHQRSSGHRGFSQAKAHVTTQPHRASTVPVDSATSRSRGEPESQFESQPECPIKAAIVLPDTPVSTSTIMVSAAAPSSPAPPRPIVAYTDASMQAIPEPAPYTDRGMQTVFEPAPVDDSLCCQGCGFVLSVQDARLLEQHEGRLTCNVCHDDNAEADHDTPDAPSPSIVHQSTQTDHEQESSPHVVTCLDCGTEMYTQDGILLVSRPNSIWNYTCPMCLRLLAKSESGSPRHPCRGRSPPVLDASPSVIEPSSDLHLAISECGSITVEEVSTPTSQPATLALDSACLAENEDRPASPTDSASPLPSPAFPPHNGESTCMDEAPRTMFRTKTTQQAPPPHKPIQPDSDGELETSRFETDSHVTGMDDKRSVALSQTTEDAEQLVALDDTSAVRRIGQAHEGVTTPTKNVEAGHSQSQTQDSFENRLDPFGPIIVISHTNGITSVLDMVSATTSNVFDNDLQSGGEWSDTDDGSCDVASTISSVSIEYEHRPTDQDAKDLARGMSRMSLSPRPVARRVGEVSGDTLI